MNMRLRLSRTDLLKIGSIPYRPIEIEASCIILERADQPGITQSFSHENIHDLLGSAGTRYQPGYFEPARSRLRQTAPVGLLSELDADTRSLLLWRMDAFANLRFQA